jgi:hypothetical protein
MTQQTTATVTPKYQEVGLVIRTSSGSEWIRLRCNIRAATAVPRSYEHSELRPCNSRQVHLMLHKLEYKCDMSVQVRLGSGIRRSGCTAVLDRLSAARPARLTEPIVSQDCKNTNTYWSMEPESRLSQRRAVISSPNVTQPYCCFGTAVQNSVTVVRNPNQATCIGCPMAMTAKHL